MVQADSEQRVEQAEPERARSQRHEPDNRQDDATGATGHQANGDQRNAGGGAPRGQPIQP